MKKTTALAATLAVSATGAYAGGMDRSGQSIAPLFEDGTYVELTFGSVSPDVSGTLGGVLSSGDMAESYTRLAGAYKRDLTDNLSMALIIDEPFGADVDYGSADPGYTFLGATAAVDTTAVTGILRYEFAERYSVYGGLRVLKSSGEVYLPAIPLAAAPEYAMSTSHETDVGYLLGVSYEIPDIALRASLTYNSQIDIDFDTTETLTGFGTFAGTMPVSMPASVNFDFQTGIAADTLLMFSARWAEWTKTDITPQYYDNLVSYSEDVWSYSLGVGRRFNDKLSGSIAIGYEPGSGDIVGNLGPTDGYKSVTAGLKYQITDQTALSGGVSYVWIGDATTSTILADFADNTAVGVGFKLSHTY
ncbi:OmpP1/FadL family transporter [Celeribacter litoreus]|uniref:OmpP1/FadL family transporter n=1 Tax=Celeribacter litoreus TaxID=2876714 RepID=UPI001CCFF599|nr:outer membrane protein transport protein [Celeribacter litoreus]MCA0045011.1 outer membrane protein transport protein [Celeribacter litoreus]